ncbi:hypothetical protein IDM40_19790 [Nocardiopsis sp. HNM0947]|uniref:WXG100 family type VII secretion target n=1 Tax=Nocardiopsis coralli TaxID=2772213 RepID=A0ABR9PAQ0_9ACTN|nr:hypothetical protein [Nocardiopsis coralli]MBE3000916.1 hypothetical protein [Nocardiopsis coralli]
MDISGSPGKIMDLADSERTYKGHLETVLDQVEDSVKKSLTEWYGSSSDDFEARYEEFREYRESVSSSFDGLIHSTEIAAENWSVTSASARTRFQA